ncbi:MAG: LytTR family DNA-binding domain-containing protein [Tahibacter sp.]
MKLLIVDDEAHARSKLLRFLLKVDDVTIVGEAEDGIEALRAVAALRPDVVLLDIQMPGMGGLEVAAALPAGVHCVFVTAYDAYALRAFDLNAVDYLLKPYTRERLLATVARLRERCAGSNAAPRQSLVAALHSLQPVPRHWLVPHRGVLRKIPLSDVQWVQAADNYIELHAPPGNYLDRTTLAAFLAHPAAADFVRVHRSYAVNRAHVQGVATRDKGDAELTLSSGHTLRLSRRFREHFLPDADVTGGA